MRRLAAAVCGLLVVSLQAAQAQAPAKPKPAPARPAGAQAAAPDALPVRRVVLYKNGIGYFEHLGRVHASQTVTVDFNSTQLDDVLKTLTVLDLGGGRVTGVSYNSEAPLAQRLGSLRLQVGEHATLAQLLDALRGARLEVRAAGGIVNGRLLGVESRIRTRNGETTTVNEITLVGDDGQIRIVEITPAVTVKLAQRDSAEQVDTFLGLLASTRAQDRRRMSIATVGTGDRDLLVGYISEVPIWKTTYRIVLPSGPGATTLQGWAIVDNTIGADWRNVQLSLVAGAPQSFIQQLSQPMYARRPIVPLPQSLLPTPQLHQATLDSSTGGVYGQVADSSGAPLPGATVKVLDESGHVVGQSVADGSGRYTIDSLAPGTYMVSFELMGFQSSREPDVDVGSGEQTRANGQLGVSSLAETVTVSGQRPSRKRAESGGDVSGVTGGIVAASPMPSRDTVAYRAAAIEPIAQGRELGDLFEYRIDAPISIDRNRSALVPILRADVAAERVSLWNSRAGGGRPLRSLWLTNSSGLTLDSGSFTVLDAGSFAGEGLVDALKPGEKRLLSYAVDLGVQVEPRNGDEQRTVTRISIAHGVLVQHSEQVARRVYTIRNSDASGRRVVIEHPIRAGWKLAGTVTPAETSADAYRFVIDVPSAKTETLTVTEQQPLDSTYRIADITDQQVELFVRESGGDDTLRAALVPIAAARAALGAIAFDLNTRAGELKRISDDQQRVRENMKALKGSSEEQQLTKRYAAQLAQQEDRVEALRKESAELENRRRAAQAELARRIESLMVDVTVKPPAARR